MLKKILTPVHRFILIVTLFLMVTGNHAFFSKLLQSYPITSENLFFLISITAFFTLATALLLNLICYGRFTSWMLALITLLASLAAYFMDSYGVVIDSTMLANVAQTNTKEATELLTVRLVWRLIVFGILPAYLILKYCPPAQSIRAELVSKVVLSFILILLMVAVAAPLTSTYASFIRQHKTVRLYSNPSYFCYSLVKYLSKTVKAPLNQALINIAADAKHIDDHQKNELLILVVGEAARADHFSLNGYERETNPELKKLDVISLPNVTSCGTSTAVSVPCMFSGLGRKSFDHSESMNYENVLDVLSPKVDILWRDNNSDSKGVAARIAFEDFRTPALNPVCDIECRDIGMLSGLDQHIEQRKGKDVLIVLHQMGNHGPAYYKRYPANFEKFTPACKSDDLGKCSDEQIRNAYDNAILYTDYFLSEVIGLLKRHNDTFEVAMLYVSDHGESLGEYGVYLHGAPYQIAPKAQTSIPAIIWMGSNFDYSHEQLRPYINLSFSQDDLFCALLTTFEVESNACVAWRPALKQNRNHL
ncbi:MAG: phosphoethanolamine--lipid A transferase [Methylotenera sp.]|uniref:phosphoethanolamine transferase n=1 Tax=Methylotenera sp. TaxID=2051956 RepID=UPI0027231BC2|nr:phosphoethanolamine--lipid A transferase [Methylotenera sp.]MDO9393350.1 phosphoethanolamine--lipid A transferase [Methylotenera sp.]MDP1523332.1 phosphoethanolamine--lipid A transferase [Methylotenera sp.]MDP1658361.1 phosphoethanolamine--lipid A transferase [Methylotenera sp.]MDP3308839.1 phosphoethanolamine--lipid A transferase [Methylotenera sp.]MDP3819475.1 phosphoethanolamine--lipid A transferase [Methylotenera sp.]